MAGFYSTVFISVSCVRVCVRAIIVPSLPADRPSGFVMPVLFFRLCFLRLACGEGGGSSFGLVALPGVEPAGSLIPLAERAQHRKLSFFSCLIYVL